MRRSDVKNLLSQLRRHKRKRKHTYADFSSATPIDIGNRAIYKRGKQPEITKKIPRIKEKVLV